MPVALFSIALISHVGNGNNFSGQTCGFLDAASGTLHLMCSLQCLEFF